MNTENTKKEHITNSVDRLTEENQRYALGVLQALAFAQCIGEAEKTDESQQKGEKLSAYI